MREQRNNLMHSSILEKTIATMLVITLTFANIIMLGSYITQGKISYAVGENLENQSIVTNHKNVEFDSYFKEENGSKTHSLVCDVNQSTNIYLNINVKQQGYLKNAVITLNSEEDEELNYTLGETESQEYIQEIKNNTISLKQINAGTNAVIALPIKLIIGEEFETSKLNANTNVKLVAIYMDENGEETKIEKEITINLGWKAEYKTNLEQNIEKYIPYELGEEKGIILQLRVKSSLKEEKTNLPITTTKIIAQVPSFNEHLPGKVNVTALAKEATNGRDTILTQDDYIYNSEESTLTIELKNKEVNGKVWSKSGTDELLITYIYGAEAFESIVEENMVNSKIKSIVEIANNQGSVKVENEIEGQAPLKEKIGETVSFAIEAQTKEISKGKIYAKQEAEYTNKINANISYKELVDSIQMNITKEQFVTKEENKLNATKSTYIKELKIAKENLENILGENGYIEIYNSQNQLIYTIDKSITPKEDGTYNIILSEKEEEITLKTTKPQNEGILTVEIIKAIKSGVSYTQEQIEELKSINTTVVGQVKYKGTQGFVNVEESKSSIALEDTKTNVEVEINKENLSSLIENDNVEIKLILNNNKETSDLYKDPTFQIELPSFIEDIEIKSTNILFDDELKIANIEKVIIDGRVIIKLQLEGTQTKFTSNVANGTNITINTKMNIKEFIPTTKEEVNVFYTNENATNYAVQNAQGYGFINTVLGTVTPEGIITKNSISNYNGEAAEVTSTNGDEAVGKLEVLGEAKTATNTITIMNNYESSCTDVVILGRFPAKGNKDIESNKELGSTFDTKVTPNITTTDLEEDRYKVYYSENINATKELDNEQNGWKLGVIPNAKSYMIMFNTLYDETTQTVSIYELASTQKLQFSYQFEVPENLQHNEYAYTTYAVYHTVNGEQKVEYADKVGISTGEGAIVNLEMVASVGDKTLANDDIIKEGEIIKYTIKLTNTSNVALKNGTLKAKMPNGTTLDKADGATQEEGTLVWSIQNLDGNQTLTKTFTVQANSLESNSSDTVNIYTSATLTGENMEKEVASTALQNSVKGASIKLKSQYKRGTFSEIAEGEEIAISSEIQNKSSEAIEKLKIEINLTNQVKYTKVEIKNNLDQVLESGYAITYNEETSILVITIDKLDAYEFLTIETYGKVKNLATGTYTAKFDVLSKAYAEKIEEYVGNSVSYNVTKPHLEVVQTRGKENKYIVEGEVVEYIIEIKNTGSKKADNVQLIDQLPDGMKAKSITYVKPSSTFSATPKDTSKVETTKFYINAGETVTIKIKVVAQNLPMGTEELTVKNKATVKADNIEELTTNEIEYIIEQKPEEDNNGGNNGGNSGDNNGGNSGENNSGNNSGEQIKTYKITGTAWIDSNKNGAMDNTEEKVKNMPVMLIDTKTGSIKQNTNTNESGEYSFTKIEKGSYFVLFEYDNANYTITEYKKDGIVESINSDAIETKINQDGQIKVAAISNTIDITTTSISGINVGLVETEKFDLSLEKYITKITVQTAKSTKTYEYTKEDLAKIDVDRKEIDGATVTIEYKIAVKNEGAIPGYAKTIVDYIPKDTNFDGTKNVGWKIGTDGNLYNTSLEETIINPKETKEVTLILSKKMTSENTGTINNRAEIYEAFNEKAQPDVDSTPGNNAQGEDDISAANAIITIKTGQIAMYITIAMLSIAILGTGIYFIKKKVLR